MNFLDGLMVIALVCILWAVVALLLISKKVSENGTRVRVFLIIILFFRYISAYEDLTKKETGKAGPLIYHFIIPWWIALILVVTWVILSLFL